MIQRLSALLLMVALLFPAPALAGTPESVRNAPDCSRQYAAMASVGRPSPDSVLLASSSTRPVQPPASAAPAVSQSYVVRPGDTLAGIAARFATTVRALVQANGIANPNFIRVGQQLVIPGGGTATVAQYGAQALVAPLLDVWLDGEIIQGEVALIWVRAEAGATVQGQLDDQYVPFRGRCGLLWGLVAFDALLEAPATYPLILTVTTARGRTSTQQVGVPLGAGSFYTGRINWTPDKQRLLQPELVRAEHKRLYDLFASLPDREPAWTGSFRLPLNSYVTNLFGTRTVYEDGRMAYHEGIDYRGRTGTPIPAPAPGTVVVAEPLTVRGNTVYLDHGAGVVSGYFHMSEIDVTVGQFVQTGDILGKVGATGLATGPHLHWEMRVNGRWVNPNRFVNRIIP